MINNFADNYFYIRQLWKEIYQVNKVQKSNNLMRF